MQVEWHNVLPSIQIKAAATRVWPAGTVSLVVVHTIFDPEPMVDERATETGPS